MRDAQRVLNVLLAVAVAVSVVHYADNTIAYDSYPQPTTGPAPSRAVVAVAWFVFTGFGAAGWLAFRRGRVPAAAVLLALYSFSGLVGLGHYTVPGAVDMAWWRHAHIAADIACGVAVLVFAVSALRRFRRGAGATSVA